MLADGLDPSRQLALRWQPPPSAADIECDVAVALYEEEADGDDDDDDDAAAGTPGALVIREDDEESSSEGGGGGGGGAGTSNKKLAKHKKRLSAAYASAAPSWSFTKVRRCKLDPNLKASSFKS